MRAVLLLILLIPFAATAQQLTRGYDPHPYSDPMTDQMARWSERVRQDGERQMLEVRIRQLEEERTAPKLPPPRDSYRSPWIDHPTCIGAMTCGDIQYIRR
ncbi:MAG: hypothetical protein KIT73_02510 [Burkholderiales bacterium]|nr:hypothetical protein [Burkholderiales bacterium]